MTRLSPSKMKGSRGLQGLSVASAICDDVCSFFLNADIQSLPELYEKFSVVLPKMTLSPTSVLFLVYILRASVLKKSIMLCACVRTGRYLACVEDLIIYCTLTYL